MAIQTHSQFGNKRIVFSDFYGRYYAVPWGDTLGLSEADLPRYPSSPNVNALLASLNVVSNPSDPAAPRQSNNNPLDQIQEFWNKNTQNKVIVGAVVLGGFMMVSKRRLF